MYQGRRYDEVFRRDAGYCEWALRVQNPRGALRDFVEWLQSRREAGHEPGPPDIAEFGETGESGSEDLEPEGVWTSGSESEQPFPFWSTGPFPSAAWQMGRVLQASRLLGLARAAHTASGAAWGAALLDQLPRIAYSAAHFSGNPHPESCPICIEDFGPTGSADAEIVLTPCLHVFHATCLKGWLVKKLECPTCRWDISDSGEQKAVSRSREPALAATGAVDLSDDSQG